MKFHPLEDAFTEVALDNIVTFSEQVIVHAALFGQHGFALYQRMRLVLLQDFIDNRIMFRRVFRPMDDRPVGRGVPFEFLQKSIQMAVRIEFDITGQFAQAFPFGKRMAHFIPFGTNHPEGFVVPGFLLAVLDEAGSCFLMFRAHNPEANISTI